MLSKQPCVVALWAFVPLAVAAQQTPLHPTEPGAPVATLRYESAFNAYRPSLDDAASPDKVWRSANQLVGNPEGQPAQTKDSAAQPIAAPDARAGTSAQNSPDGHGKHH